jgi:hypothetical protein
MHRFVWDLHYAFPEGVHTSFYGPFPPTVLPGNYTVKLTVNNSTISQPLVVKMDPRVKTSQADLKKLFEAETRLAGRVGELSSAVRQAQQLKTNIAARKKETAFHVELTEALSTLDKKAADLVGAESEADFEFGFLALPGEKAVTLRDALAATTALLAIVERSDSAASADAVANMEKWETPAKDLVEQWKSLWEHDRVRVNALLQKAKFNAL